MRVGGSLPTGMDGPCSRGGCVDVKLDMTGSRGCIPADAGPTPCGRNGARRPQVHPCWRRVYASQWRVSENDGPGSLLARGLPVSRLAGCRRDGRIPAGAGSARTRNFSARWSRVYPCGCGDSTAANPIVDRASGVSLLTRGLPALGHAGTGGRGWILARVGYIRWLNRRYRDSGVSLLTRGDGCYSWLLGHHRGVSRRELGEHEDWRVLPTRSGWIRAVAGVGETGQ